MLTFFRSFSFSLLLSSSASHFSLFCLAAKRRERSTCAIDLRTFLPLVKSLARQSYCKRFSRRFILIRLQRTRLVSLIALSIGFCWVTSVDWRTPSYFSRQFLITNILSQNFWVCRSLLVYVYVYVYLLR